MLKFDVIVCVDSEWGIAKNGTMPWVTTPEGRRDMLWFRTYTTQVPSSVIMGRATFDTLKAPLEGRVNIVMSKNDMVLPKGCLCVKGLDEALMYSFENGLRPLVIGGASVYRLALVHQKLDKVLVTHLSKRYECDLMFPKELMQGFNVRCIKTEPINVWEYKKNW